MRKYLLPQSGKFYKSNLHCHSTISDGRLTPEQLKELYMGKGYSVIAYTDHDVLIAHNDLTDEKFVALNGYEMEINEEAKNGRYDCAKTCHMCLVALKPDNVTQVCYHRSKYLFGNAMANRDKVKFDETKEDFERYYTPECINEMMKTGRDNGFFVTYNHPGWSLETFAEYGKYQNMNAMEICNFGCTVEAFTDYNEKEYDEMLRGGQRIYCIATDDNHNGHPVTSPHFDSFGGFTMIKAEKLDYESITDALLAGHFYASQGPEIYDLYFEDGVITVKCSDAARIGFNTGRRHAQYAYGENGEMINSASFRVVPEDEYVRLTVIDGKGFPANTNAYFTDELFS